MRESRRWIRLSVAAKKMDVPERTLRRWCVNGRIRAAQRGPGGFWYIDLTALKSSGSEFQNAMAYQLIAHDQGID